MLDSTFFSAYCLSWLFHRKILIVISLWWQLDLLWHIQNDTNLVFVWQLSFWQDQGPAILGYNLWLILIPRWTVLDRSHRLPVKPWNKQFIIDYWAFHSIFRFLFWLTKLRKYYVIMFVYFFTEQGKMGKTEI